MKKKITALLLVVALVAIAVAGSTMAYFSDTDQAVNVATVGNVKIEQHEYERVLNADGTFKTATIDNQTSYVLQTFTQGKPLMPSAINTTTWEGWDWDSTAVRMSQVDSYGGMQVFKTASNALDKFVVVENTGRSGAYIRTLVAIEVGTGNPALVGTSYHGTWTSNDIGVINVDGNNYYLKEYVYNGGQLSDGSWRHEGGLLPAGDTAYPSLAQVYLKSEATNEDAEALDGNGNGLHEILVFTQAVQAAGFENAEAALNAAFGDITTTNHPWKSEEPRLPILVSTDAELQAALDSAVDGDTIVFADDITGDVTATQKPDVAITIDGNGYTMAGVLTVDGKSGTYLTAGLTVKNLTFKADSISADACIRLGNGDNATRYTCNVTVDGCTFDVPGAVGVKSYTGGDKNLVITGCTATSNAHSLCQLKGIDGVLVEKCNVNSKNGLNFNNSDNVKVVGCKVNVLGYAVRFGESSGGTGAAETYLIDSCVLTSANDDGDATIILRGTADNSTLTIVNTVINGNPGITNTASNATVIQ